MKCVGRPIIAPIALIVVVLAIFAAPAARAVTSATAGPGPIFLNPTSIGYWFGPNSSFGLVDATNLGIGTFTLPSGVTRLSLAGSGSLTAEQAGAYMISFYGSATSNGLPVCEPAIPVDYIFTLDPGAGSLNGWTVNFDVFQGANDHHFGASGTAADVAGHAVITGINPSSPVTQWYMELTVTWTASAAGQVLAFDLPLNMDHAPEPFSFLLAGAGIAALVFAQRRRRAG